jgi:hypothetical protein
MDVYFSSEMVDVYSMFKEFRYYKKNFGEKLNLVPHYVSEKEHFYDKENPKSYPECVSGGKYCAKVVKELNITNPQLIIMENIRQDCILTLKRSEVYLDYMSEFYDNCLNKTKTVNFHKNCSEKVMESLSININNVKKCIESSFDSKDYLN